MIKVDIELTDDVLENVRCLLGAFSGKNGRQIAPATKAVYDRCTRAIQECWRGWAMGGDLAGASPIKNPSPKLANSINIVRLNDFTSEIGTDSAYMRRIQEGTPEFDMKEKYPYGRKSRVSKDGSPFLIIPFRWGTPNQAGGARAHFGNTIPANLYDVVVKAKTFKRSERKMSAHIEPNARGEAIERADYSWGDRLREEGNVKGLVAMNDTTGRRPKSTYFTFRIISVNSPKDSWIRKQIPPNDVVGAVKKKMEPEISRAMDEAIRIDLGLN